MNTDKIVGYIALLIAIIVGIEIVAIPFALAPVLLLICGLVLGYNTPAETHVRVLVSAMALTMFVGTLTLTEIPEIGFYLQDIVNSIAIYAQGAAFLIIFKNLYKRLAP
ncbi:MAG: hypothetical protein O3B03_00995 [Proteobacteria bacterium]|nr:hypothetical protein [Pseudomonadota bacterium]MDA1331061.1 hypothetical protein [Pseudomonadota bacterium]